MQLVITLYLQADLSVCHFLPSQPERKERNINTIKFKIFTNDSIAITGS